MQDVYYRKFRNNCKEKKKNESLITSWWAQAAQSEDAGVPVALDI